MGIIENGILGGLSGKVSGVVGSNWKGIKTLRAYAKPSNPRTSLQQGQRTKFTYTVEFAKSILSSVLNVYWKNKNAFMSPFNSFMKLNVPNTSSTTGINTNNKITSGSLEASTITSSKYIADYVMLEFNVNTMANGLGTDEVLLIVYDKVNKVSFVNDNFATRGDGEVTVTIGSGRNVSDLIAFLSFHRGVDKELLVSTSVSSLVTL